MNGKNLVRLREAAKVIDVDPKTLRRRIERGDIEGYRLGPRLIYVDIDDVYAAMQSTTTQGTEEK